jgi:hypothetical protein
LPSGSNGDVPNVAAPATPEAGAGSVRLQGDAAALRLDVHEAAIADVLAAMDGAFDMQYRSSILLDEAISGTYAGSLGHVISRVLDGYNYAIKRENSKLEVIIFEKRGEQAIAAPLPAVATKRRGRLR